MTGIRSLIVAALAVALSGFGMTAAQARPLEHIQYDETSTEVDEEFCGDLEVRIDFHDRGVLVIKQTGRERLPRHTVTHHGEVVLTNLATEKSFRIGWHYVEQEAKVTSNGDGTFTVLYQVPGPEITYGPDGQRLFVSGGMFRLKLTVDDAGTPGDPSDDFVVDEEFVGDFGGQPQEPFDFCDAFHELTG